MSTNQSPAEALRQAIEAISNTTDVGYPPKLTPADIDDILKHVTAYAATVEREGRIDELNIMVCNRHYGEGYAEFFTELVNERLAALQGPPEGVPNG